MNETLISEVNVVPIRPQNGLVAFASCVLNDQFFCGNIAIYTSPSSQNGYRLVFPNKKLTSGLSVACFYPINNEAGKLLSSEIIKKYIEVMDHFNY